MNYPKTKPTLYNTVFPKMIDSIHYFCFIRACQKIKKPPSHAVREALFLIFLTTFLTHPAAPNEDNKEVKNAV
jgi:hypothetical protein